MKTVTANVAFKSVSEYAEKIRNDDAHSIEVMDTGDAWRQGDIQITRLNGIPAMATKGKPVAQLAPGETQGSRHCIADLSKVTIYSRYQGTPLDGPVIDAPCGVLIEHPEHGDVALPPGVYGVTFQRAHADELRRTLD